MAPTLRVGFFEYRYCSKFSSFDSTRPISMPHDEPSPASLPPDVGDVAGLPAELPGDPRRQAVASIQGTVYQAWWSIDVWLQLENADEVIYLEGAEDFDVIRSSGAIAVQVRRTAAPISLGNAKAHEALENFWELSKRETNRRVALHYLTTSSIAFEQDADFDGLSGIEAWRVGVAKCARLRRVSGR